MLAVQPGGLSSAQEELGSVGSGSSVCHREDSGSSVLCGKKCCKCNNKNKLYKVIITASKTCPYLQVEVLVGELLSVDRLSSGTVVVGEVSTLAHESGDHTVEGACGESESLLSSAQGTEVLSGLRHNVGTEGHLNASGGGSTNGHVEEADGVGHCECRCCG